MHRVAYRAAGLLLFVCLVPLAVAQEGGKFSLGATDKPAPTELSDDVRKLLGPGVEVQDGSGKTVAEVWFRKAIPADATPAQIKTGVTYREMKQTELFGAIRFNKDWRDYRKTKIPAGLYTLRLAFQPTDGKHTADISEYPEFLLVTSAKTDTDPAPIDAMKLQEQSSDSIGSGHPGVFMLAPNPKPGKAPEIVARPREQWVLNVRSALEVGGKATGTDFGIGLTLVGHTPD